MDTPLRSFPHTEAIHETGRLVTANQVPQKRHLADHADVAGDQPGELASSS